MSSSSRIESSPLYNKDLAPATSERRTWGTYNFAALWVSMSVNILTYMLAASLIQGGMNWKQAVATVFLGNTIVLIPMLLNSHPGARYGIPFPVLARASFGVLGANVAAVLRALVACGWFGIQTWIGGEAINTLITTLAPAWGQVAHSTAICFLAFWLINLAVILKGIEYIRHLQGISAPILLAVGLLLLAWAYKSAGGFGPMLSAPSRFVSFSDFLKFLIPALNGTVGFWATVSLNIPDFTRFARSQRQQVIGQALGLPTTMTLYSLIGILVTSATVVIYGTAIWDPVQLLSRFHSPVAVVISLLAILLATLNVNIGANVVSPANDFSNLWPRKISFRTGGIITCFMGIALMPWKLLSDYGTFIFGWLGGYAAFLGPVAGIMICDYFVIRRRVLVVDDLYLRGGAYEYSRGFNWLAVIALALGAGTALVGLVVPALRVLYSYSWFVGFAVAFVTYYASMRIGKMPSMSKQERFAEYFTMVMELWGKQISGPILALVAIIAAFVNARYANDATATATVAEYIAWVTGGISALLVFVAQYKAWSEERSKYEAEAGKLEKIENGKPRLVLKDPGAIHCEPVTQTFFQPGTGIILKQRVDNFLKVRFINDPELSVPSSRATGVTAQIDYYRCSDNALVLSLDGRWSESTQPSAISPLESKVDLLPATFLQGQQRSLDIAFCDGESGKYYAWNNDNYNAINEFFVYPKHVLEGDRFRVEIRLRGDWIDKRVSFIFSVKDKGFVIEPP